MWMANATVSVDSFFLIGGVVAAYVMTRKVLSRPDMTPMDYSVSALLAYLGRFLRLVPCMLVLSFIAVTITYHIQEEPLFSSAMPGESTEITNIAFFGDNCNNWEWMRTSFLVAWTGTIKCNAWLWYVNDEYWMFLLMP